MVWSVGNLIWQFSIDHNMNVKIVARVLISMQACDPNPIVTVMVFPFGVSLTLSY